MKNIVRFWLLSCVTGTVSFVHADDALLIKSNCLACHALDKRKYGPTFNEVALKYANDGKAAEKLAEKIKVGGTGVWGDDMMPSQPNLSKEDAFTLAKYILSLK
jgi:cytochrome c